MKSFKIPMTIEEFHLAEFPFGWKDEYCDGFAYISPRSHGVLMKMPIKSKTIDNLVEVLPVTEVKIEQLYDLFFLAFVESVEFCDYKRSEIKRAAKKNVNKFFEGERGIPQIELCRVAVLPNKKKTLIGACLISKYKYGFKNEILFVQPSHQKQGIGTALVSGVLNDLDKLGENVFWSEYHICNEQSAKWHKKFGFVEVPDVFTLRLRRNYLKHEICRNEQLNNLHSVETLNSLLKQTEDELESLEKLEEKDFNAAWLRWKYDY
ncbi:MAG: GNAT family N-acetyltransferase [Pyrinomonadaceae bacterium]